MVMARADSPASIATAAALPSNAVRQRFIGLERRSNDRTIERHHLETALPRDLLYRLPISLSPPVQRSELRRWRSLRDPERIRGLAIEPPTRSHVAKSGCVGRGALSIPETPAADGLKTTDAGGQHSSRKSDGGRALQHCLF